MEMFLESLLDILDDLLPLSIGLAVSFLCLSITIRVARTNMLLGFAVCLACLFSLCLLFLFL